MKTAVGEVQGEALTLVNTTNTAIAAESGSLPVLGTPFMLALMEKATCEAHLSPIIRLIWWMSEDWGGWMDFKQIYKWYSE